MKRKECKAAMRSVAMAAHGLDGQFSICNPSTDEVIEFDIRMVLHIVSATLAWSHELIDGSSTAASTARSERSTTSSAQQRWRTSTSSIAVEMASTANLSRITAPRARAVPIRVRDGRVEVVLHLEGEADVDELPRGRQVRHGRVERRGRGSSRRRRGRGVIRWQARSKGSPRSR